MVYIHVPFCRSFCTYCDFYSETVCRGRDSGIVEDYVRGVEAEARSRRDEILRSKGINTLYIGGGTPSVLPPCALKRLADAAGGGPWEEFTVEMNPEDIVEKGAEYVRALRGIGVTRASLGVQSLQDEVLGWMRRRHSADGARQAFRILREEGFDNISVDIIFGIGGFSRPTLERTLEEICLQWRPEHISAYQLSVEEGSALARMQQEGRFTPLDEESCRRQYESICGTLRSRGYRHYEISNWALEGREAVHNSAYWSRAPYVGLGPGAHSLRIEDDGTQTRTWNSESLRAWHSDGETLSEEEIREEELMLGLRTSQGTADGRKIPEKDWFVSDDIISTILAQQD